VSEVLAAGGLVVLDGAVLVVHRARYDDWSLPKGKLEEGETFEQAALREVLEETGYACALGEPLGSTEYESRGRLKEVRWFRMSPLGEAGPREAAIDEIRWVTRVEAVDLLSYARDRGLLNRLR
jgi:8-oxo-dGTP diphosphatase